MKIIVAGSRTFKDWQFMFNTLEYIFSRITPSEIVCGESDGPDLIGSDYGYLNGIWVESFPANWDKYGKAAGPIRNAQMAKYADALVCYNNGTRGSTNMIKQAKKHGLSIRVYNGKTNQWEI